MPRTRHSACDLGFIRPTARGTHGDETTWQVPCGSMFPGRTQNRVFVYTSISVSSDVISVRERMYNIVVEEDGVSEPT